MADKDAYKTIVEKQNLKKRYTDEIDVYLFKGDPLSALRFKSSFQILEKLFGSAFFENLDRKIHSSMKSKISNKIKPLCDNDKLTKNVIYSTFQLPTLFKPQSKIKLVVENFDDDSLNSIPKSSSGFELEKLSKSYSNVIELGKFDFGLLEMKLEDFYVEEPNKKETIYSKYYSGTRSVINPKYADIEHRYNLARSSYDRALNEYQISMNNWNISVQNARYQSTQNLIILPPAQPVPPNNNHLRILEMNLNSTPRYIEQKVYTDYELIKQTTDRKIELIYSYKIYSMDGRDLGNRKKKEFVKNDRIVEYLNLHPQDVNYKSFSVKSDLKAARQFHVQATVPQLISQLCDELKSHYTQNKRDYLKDQEYYGMIKFLSYKILNHGSSNAVTYSTDQIRFLYELSLKSSDEKELLSHVLSTFIKNSQGVTVDQRFIYDSLNKFHSRKIK